MSPRAACQLERLGFLTVYDYAAGIADWKAAGLPTVGAESPTQRVAAATRTDVPTCIPTDTIGAARDKTFAAGWDTCVVISCDNTVIGRLRGQAWNADGSVTVDQVMDLGPTTVRPDDLLQPLHDRMKRRGVASVLVTTPQGTLIGAVRQP